MKKFHYPTFIGTRLMALALAFGSMGLVSSCSNEDDTNTARDSEPIRTYYMSVDATKSGDALTRALTLDGNTISTSWATTENVYVQGTLLSSGSTFWFDGSIQPQSAGTSTRLNGQISLPSEWSGTIPSLIGEHPEFTLQFPRSGELDYTGQVGTLEDIATKYDYAIATGVLFDIVGDHIVGTSSANFVNQQAIVKFTLKDKADGTTLLSPTALTITYGSKNISLTIPKATYTTNGNGVLYVAIPGDSEQNITLSATCSDGTYTYNKSSVTFQNCKYYDITVKMTKQP